MFYLSAGLFLVRPEVALELRRATRTAHFDFQRVKEGQSSHDLHNPSAPLPPGWSTLNCDVQ